MGMSNSCCASDGSKNKAETLKLATESTDDEVSHCFSTNGKFKRMLPLQWNSNQSIVSNKNQPHLKSPMKPISRFIDHRSVSSSAYNKFQHTSYSIA